MSKSSRPQTSTKTAKTERSEILDSGRGRGAQGCNPWELDFWRGRGAWGCKCGRHNLFCEIPPRRSQDSTPMHSSPFALFAPFAVESRKNPVFKTRDFSKQSQFLLCWRPKNKANSKPNKPIFKPKQSQFDPQSVQLDSWRGRGARAATRGAEGCNLCWYEVIQQLALGKPGGLVQRPRRNP